MPKDISEYEEKLNLAIMATVELFILSLEKKAYCDASRIYGALQILVSLSKLSIHPSVQEIITKGALK